MPRRKLIRINAAELDIWKELSAELFNSKLFNECDFDTVEIIALKRNPQPRIADINIRVECLKQYIRNNGNCAAGKQELCKIMKISRPTLNKWLDDELISKGKTEKPWGSHQKFDLETVLKDLKKQIDTK
jgi:hypothetical protein